MVPRLARIVAMFGPEDAAMPVARGEAEVALSEEAAKLGEGENNVADVALLQGIAEGSAVLSALCGFHNQEAWMYCERTRDPTRGEWEVTCDTRAESDMVGCDKVRAVSCLIK